MMITNRFMDRVAHPLIKVSENASIQLQKLIDSFLLSKKSTVKQQAPETDETSELTNFLNNKIKSEKSK